jgi:branched-chain amino acid transport system substrate-binding protein
MPGGRPRPRQGAGNEVVEGVISVDSVSNENAASYKALDAAYQKAMGKPVSTNVYAAMTYDMIIVLALAMEAAGPGATVAQVNAKIRDVANPEGTKVYSFAEGKKLLGEKKKINYEGASAASTSTNTARHARLRRVRHRRAARPPRVVSI